MSSASEDGLISVIIPTSPRRWEQQGILNTTMNNWRLVISDWLGASPEACR